VTAFTLRALAISAVCPSEVISRLTQGEMKAHLQNHKARRRILQPSRQSRSIRGNPAPRGHAASRVEHGIDRHPIAKIQSDCYLRQ
jgi:hypothetical protein